MLRLVLLLLLCLLPACAGAAAIRRGRRAAHARRGASLGGRGRLGGAARGRRRGGRGDRGAGRADAGGAAILRHRRRRPPAALGRRGATAFRLGRAGGRRRPRPRRSCSCATASRCGSTRRRSAGAPSACRARCGCSRRRTAPMAACPGRGSSRPRSRWPRRVSRFRRASPRRSRRKRSVSAATRRARALFLLPDGSPLPRRASPAQSGTGRDLARGGGGRRRCTAPRADRRGDRRSRAGAFRTPAG